MGKHGLKSRAEAVVYWARAHPGFSVLLIIAASITLWGAKVLILPGPQRRISNVMGEVRDGLVAGDADAVLQHVSPHFRSGAMDRSGLRKALKRALKEDPVRRAWLMPREWDVQELTASVRVSVQSTHHTRHGTRRATSEWIVRMEKIGDRWTVRRAQPERVNKRRVGGLNALLSLGG